MKFPTLKRSDKIALAILLPMAVISGLLVWLSMPVYKEGGIHRQPSTFFNTGYGTKAAYLVSERLGYSVSRLRRPIHPNFLEGLDGLFLLRPVVALSEDEGKNLLEWVGGGGFLVIAPTNPSGNWWQGCHT